MAIKRTMLIVSFHIIHLHPDLSNFYVAETLLHLILIPSFVKQDQNGRNHSTLGAQEVLPEEGKRKCLQPRLWDAQVSPCS